MDGGPATTPAQTIGLLFARPADRALLESFLRDCGYAVTTRLPDAPPAPEVALWVADEDAARAAAERLLALKRESTGVLVQLFVALTARADASGWLEAGFDDVLRMPLSKAELRARVARALRLREHSERQGELQASRLAELVRQIPAGAVVVEAPSGRILVANEELERIWRRSTLASRSIGDYGRWPGFHPDGRRYEAEEWPVARSLLRGEVVRGEEIEIERGDGTRGTIVVNSAPVRDRDGRVVAAVATDFDVTEHRRLLESERAAREIAEAAHRVEQEFLWTVSHELRTPLNAILGWTQILASGTLDAAAAARAISTVERNARSQAQIVEDLLDISRIMTGKLRIDARTADPGAIVRAASESLQPAADNRGVRLRVSIDPGLRPVTGDPDRLQQVVWNLLSNAIKFTPRGGSVEVEAGRTASHLVISVRDTGQGISAAFLPYVFDRFRQADGSMTRRSGGLGLGLAIVREIVALHGGTVEAESAGPGRGSTFTVRVPLPAAPAGPQRPGAAGGARPEADDPDCAPRLDGVSILVVEDEPDSREMLEVVLRRCGARVSACGSAADALDALDGVRPDLILSDIGLPGEDGYELIRKVRDRGHGDIPAVALTAYTRVEDRMRALEAGFQMYIAKPVEPVELVRTLEELLGGTGGDE